MNELKVKSGWTVSELSSQTEFMSLESEWDALVQETGNSPFLKHHFIRIWKDNFAPDERWVLLIARDEDERLSAVLPLVARGAWGVGIRLKELVSPSNPHSCRFDMIARDSVKAAEAFLDHLGLSTSWTLALIKDVPTQGAAWALWEQAKSRGLPVGTWDSLRSPYIPLPTTWDALRQKLQSKFQANLRRRRRKLEEKGEVSVERVVGGEQLPARLEEGFQVERSGWKGERGTAIAQSRSTRGFYTELARHLSYRRELVLYFLRLNGTPIAFHYGLASGQTYFLLKPGYDEALSECSPGQLLMEDVVKDCIARGFRELDFLGPDMPWKRNWTEYTRAHTWLYVYPASPFGLALQRAKFDWLPRAKEAFAWMTA